MHLHALHTDGICVHERAVRTDKLGGRIGRNQKILHKNLKRKYSETWLSGLGAIFRGVRKTVKSDCLSVRPHGTTALPLDGFS